MNTIARLRRDLGMSQQQLGKALSVTRTAVTNYESGRRPQIDVALRLVALANAHGHAVTLEEIYSEVERAKDS